MPAAPERVVLFRPRTILVVVGVVVLVAVALALVYVAHRAITWILIALFLALTLNPAVEFFERRGLKRGLASGIVFLLALLGIGAVVAIFVPPLVREVRDFIEAVPGIVADITAGRGPLGFLEREYDVVDRVRSAVDERGAGGVLGITAPALDVVRGIATGIVGAVAIAFLTFFMLLEGKRWVGTFLGLVPPGSRPRWQRILHGIYRSIGGWVSGALLVAFVAGVTSTVVLLATGVPYAFALGLLVALLDLIPLAGATLAAIVVATVTFATAGVVEGIIVVVFFIIYQQVENHIIYPLVYGRTVQLSGLTVLIAVLVGAELAGIIGALVAIPIAGSVETVIRELRNGAREKDAASAPAKA